MAPVAAMVASTAPAAAAVMQSVAMVSPRPGPSAVPMVAAAVMQSVKMVPPD